MDTHATRHGQSIERDNFAPRQPTGEAPAHVCFLNLKIRNRQLEIIRLRIVLRPANVIIHCRNGGPDLRGRWGRVRSGPRSLLGTRAAPFFTSHHHSEQMNNRSRSCDYAGTQQLNSDHLFQFEIFTFAISYPRRSCKVVTHRRATHSKSFQRSPHSSVHC